MSMQGFYTVMTSVGARMGTAVIAGHAIARQCSSLEALVVDGLAVAGLPLPPPPPPPFLHFPSRISPLPLFLALVLSVFLRPVWRRRIRACHMRGRRRIRAV